MQLEVRSFYGVLQAVAPGSRYFPPLNGRFRPAKRPAKLESHRLWSTAAASPLPAVVARRTFPHPQGPGQNPHNPTQASPFGKQPPMILPGWLQHSNITVPFVDKYSHIRPLATATAPLYTFDATSAMPASEDDTLPAHNS